uniref:arginine kinase n=1 Tax=Vespula pensylvanica TaxID=30213 RepID=A0A834MZM4_VESPE|nr:hypothetical protein H0235_017527 [Vespula pensylvanica]
MIKKEKCAIKDYAEDVFDKSRTLVTRYHSRIQGERWSGFRPVSRILIRRSACTRLIPNPTIDVFADLFDPEISLEYQFGFTIDDVHPDSDWGMPDDDLGNADPTGSWVLSIIVRCVRSIQEYPFYPTTNEAHYREIEDKGRRIFVNDDKSFVEVFINKNFYRTRLISMENGGKLADAYRKRIRDWAISVFSGLRLDFNLGTTIGVSVHPFLRNLALETTTGSRKFANTYGYWQFSRNDAR